MPKPAAAWLDTPKVRPADGLMPGLLKLKPELLLLPKPRKAREREQRMAKKRKCKCLGEKKYLEKMDIHVKYTFCPLGVKQHILKYVVTKPADTLEKKAYMTIQ